MAQDPPEQGNTQQDLESWAQPSSRDRNQRQQQQQHYPPRRPTPSPPPPQRQQDPSATLLPPSILAGGGGGGVPGAFYGRSAATNRSGTRVISAKNTLQTLRDDETMETLRTISAKNTPQKVPGDETTVVEAMKQRRRTPPMKDSLDLADGAELQQRTINAKNTLRTFADDETSVANPAVGTEARRAINGKNTPASWASPPSRNDVTVTVDSTTTGSSNHSNRSTTSPPATPPAPPLYTAEAVVVPHATISESNLTPASCGCKKYAIWAVATVLVAAIAAGGATVIVLDQFNHQQGIDNSHDDPSKSSTETTLDEIDWNPRQVAKLSASDAAPNDWFGTSVAMDGDRLVVGAKFREHDDSGLFDVGQVYVFTRVASGGWTEQARLLPPPGEAANYSAFGTSLALHGDLMAVGADRATEPGPREPDTSGRVYLFSYTGNRTWTAAGVVTSDDAAAADEFGVCVALEGDTLVVGAHQGRMLGEGSGSAYVFRRTAAGATGAWTQEARLLASTGGAGEEFGRSLAISGNTVVVGSRYDEDEGSNRVDTGSAYVFVRSNDNWTEQAKLTASAAVTDDRFGRSVAIHGDTIAVGADETDANGLVNSGAVYVFTKASSATWTEEAKIVAWDAEEDDEFGQSLAIEGGVLAVGTYRDDDNGFNSGSVYVFSRSYDSSGLATWTYQAKLKTSDGNKNDWFGSSLAVAGHSVAAGADGDDDDGNRSGSAYVFDLW